MTKKVPEHLGRDLNLGLDFRAKARYKPGGQLQPKDAEFIIDLAVELLKIVREEFLL